MTEVFPAPPRTAAGGDDTGSRSLGRLLSALGVVVVVVAFVLLVPELRHWMVVPVAACGALVAPDLYDWASGELDVLDPQAVIALVGTHFFVLAPLLHVTLDAWPRYLEPVTDWRQALGTMAALNFAGLLLYRGVLALRGRPRRTAVTRLDHTRFQALGWVVVLTSLITFVTLVFGFGGPGNYVATLTSLDKDLTGYGPMFLAAACFPLVVFVLVLLRARTVLRRRPFLLLVLVIAFTLVQFVVAGLHGSRSSVVWPVLIAIGACHLLITPVRRRTLVVALIVIGGFMYLYGFYKSAGADAVDVFTGGRSVDELSEQTGRDVPLLLLGDLARADIQALTLDRELTRPDLTGGGITYLGDLLFLVARDVRPDLPDKVAIGTELLYGPGAYESGTRSSQIYGLAGEATLNFGPIGAVLSFVPLALVVRVARSRYRSALLPDAPVDRRLLASVLPIIVVLVLTADLDNLLWFTVNDVAVLACLVLLSRRKEVPTSPPTAGVTTKGAKPQGLRCA
ncbi:MAG TPA: hypothetical protein VNO31_48960 [Umezawaea sp.]|nr:hypothetical protein [Umezawaea sp.]